MQEGVGSLCFLPSHLRPFREALEKTSGGTQALTQTIAELSVLGAANILEVTRLQVLSQLLQLEERFPHSGKGGNCSSLIC